MGFADISGRGETARQHLMDVTGMTEEQAEEHIELAFSLWSERSKHDWKLDLSIITDSGIKLNSIPDKSDRKTIAVKELDSNDKSVSRKRPNFPSQEGSDSGDKNDLTNFFRSNKRRRTSEGPSINDSQGGLSTKP